MRIATWNLLWRFGEWEPRQPLIERVLADLDADVVLLQETWPDQAASLAADLGLDLLGFSGGYFDQELSDVPDDERFGNAVLARSGRLLADVELAAPGDPAPRNVLLAEVGGRRVASTHLTHINDKGGVRDAQLAAIADVVGDTPTLLGGDCNLVPSSAEHAAAVESGWVDLWAQHHPGDHGPTMVPANPEIRGSRWMDDRNGNAVPPGTGVRLDYVWARNGADVASIERFGAGDGPRWPSDHLGLVVETGD